MLYIFLLIHFIYYILHIILIYYVTDDGNVFVWGYGILGLGPQVQKVLKPTMIPPTLFGNNVYNRNVKVIKII